MASSAPNEPDPREKGTPGVTATSLRREVHCADALEWLRDNPAAPGTSVVTSLPDMSELPELGFEGWRAWFLQAARAVIAWVPSDGVAIFFQSDVRHGGAWIDKGYLVQRAAEDLGASTVFHKIVCRHPPGTITHGRAAYSHLVCFTPGGRDAPSRPGPDVLADAGFKPSTKSMGVEACRLALRFVLDETPARRVIDPFCGQGTLLAVANAMGLDAVGVDKSQRACRAARKLDLELG
jgi:hypothetical protein